MVATLLFTSLTLQAGTITVRPPALLDMLPFTVRPMGVWKQKKMEYPAAALLVAPHKGDLNFSGQKTTRKPLIMTPNTVQKINGLTWYVNVRENIMKVTVLDAVAIVPGGHYTASGRMSGGPKGKMMQDALATLKTFKRL